MRINYISISLIVALLLVTACEEDYLIRLPQDQISTYDYWNTTNDLKTYVNQFYPNFDDNSEWTGGIFWFDVGTDNMIAEHYDARLAGTRVVSVSGGWNYTQIRSVNYFFESYEKCEDDFANYKQYVGEAYFFRAYFYGNLLQTYGDVPWIDKTLLPNSEELYAPRTNRNEVANYILADLDKAIEYMDSGPNEDGMRLNKEIAILYKSRIALYEGTWEKYHAGTDFGLSGSDGSTLLQEAADAAEQLINMGVYSIYTENDPGWAYWHLFNSPYDYEGHPEVMLWKKYDIDLGMKHFHQFYLPQYGGGVGITQSLVDDYLCSDGLPISLSLLYQGDTTTPVVAANRDPRLKQTMYTPGWPMAIVDLDTTRVFERSLLPASGNHKCVTGYQLNKGALPDPSQMEGGSVTPSIIFRYAEALLNFAEAKAELGTLTQNDVDKSIKLLRDRVGMPNLDLATIQPDPDWDFPLLSPVINEVRRERRIELACEGYRWNDIARWRAHHLIINMKPKGAFFSAEEYPELEVGVSVFVDENGYVDPYQASLPDGYGFDPNRDYLSSIPTEQLTLNSNLEQNPGW